MISQNIDSNGLVRVQKRPQENYDDIPDNQQRKIQPQFTNDLKIMKRLKNYVLFTNFLGQGSYGKAFIAQKEGEDQLIACKLIDRKILQSNPRIISKLKNRLQAEVDTWKEMNHPNILKFIDYAESVNNIYMFMEYCQEGSLERKLRKSNYQIDIGIALSIFRQMTAGCLYLFQQNVVHRDLKPSNILFTNDGSLKIADFGFAKFLQEDNKEQQLENTAYIGTSLFMSPQVYITIFQIPLNIQKVFQGKPYSIKTDVWSLGVLFYEVLYGKTPDFFIFNTQNDFNKIDSDLLFFPENIEIDFGLQELIKQMLVSDEQNRLGITQVATKLDAIQQKYNALIEN